jgi:hypothetical protein
VAAVGFLDEEEHFFPARIGLNVATMPRESTMCTLSYLDENAKTFIIPDTLENPLTKCLEAVIISPKLRFYASASIVLDGVKVGTFCVCDTMPRCLKERDAALLIDMAACVSDILTARNRRWMQEHLNGISQSTAIMSSIKRPLEDVSCDALQIYELVKEIDNRCCPSPFSTSNQLLSSKHWSEPDIQWLSSFSSISDMREHPHESHRNIHRNFSQDTICADHCNPSACNGSCNQSLFHRLRSSSSVSQEHSTTGDTAGPSAALLQKLKEVAEYLREDVKCLGHAIDCSIQRMLELGLWPSVEFAMSSVASSPRVPAT